MAPALDPGQQIAARYLAHWLAGVGNGACLYVEGYATAASVERVRSLPATSEALVLQEDPALAARLRASLGDTGNAHVIEASVAQSVALIAGRAAAVPDALVCLNPPAPGHLPLDAIRVLGAVPSVDLWIRFPHEDLHKLARFGTTPLADLPPYARRIVDGYGLLLDDPRGGWAAKMRRIDAEQGSRAAHRALAGQFWDRLAAAGDGKVLKAVDIKLPNGNGLYVAALASNPLRLLALNAAIEEHDLDQFVCWGGERFRHEPPPPLAEALELFAVEREPAARRQLHEAALAEVIAGRFLGQRVSWGEVLRTLLDTDALPEDPARALRVLRRGGRAVFRSLRELGAEVSFPEKPILPTRRTRASGALWGDSEPLGNEL